MSNLRKFNDEIFNSYLIYLKQNYAKQTQIAYTSKVKLFIQYLNDNNIDVTNFNFNILLDFSSRTFVNFGDTTRYVSIAALKNFIHYLNLKNINNIINVQQITLPKKKLNEMRVYTNKEIKTIFELAKHNLELHIMLILGLFYYFTSNELGKLKISDIDQNNSILSHNKRKNIKINKKHMQLIQKLVKTNSNSTYLFSVRSKSGIKSLFEKYIISNSNISNIEFKRLNNMCIFMHYQKGLTPIEVSLHFKISIQSANKMYQQCNSKENKINNLL